MFLENAPNINVKGKMDVSNIHFINANAGGAFMAKYNIGVDYHKKFSYLVVKEEKGRVLMVR